ncbi:MAG: methylglyoxal synthase [Pseudomonadota bacterium]
MDGRKRIAFTAHDAVKPALSAWAFANERVLAAHELTATGNSGRAMMEATRLSVTCVRAGALGGDLELGAMVADGQVDILVLLLDPLTPQPHDIDPAPLLRIASIAQIAVATTETTADFIIRSEMMSRPSARRSDAPALQPALQRIAQRATS